MGGLSNFRLRWLRTIGQMPSAGKIEARRKAFMTRYTRFQAYENGQEFARYKALRDYVDSGEAERVREECRLQSYAGSREAGLLEEFNQLGHLRHVQDAAKGKGDTQNPDYLRYRALQQEVEAPEFRERVNYLKSKDKFSLTEAGRKLAELNTLSRSKELKWYESMRQKPEIQRYVQEQEVFFEDFASGSLDSKVWLKRFFWGDAMLGKPYSFVGDAQCYTDGANLRIENSCLIISTRPEDAKAMAWDTKLGFIPKSYKYTSGLVNTGQSFRMHEGRLEAKIRFSGEPGIVHSLYLCGDKAAPQVDLFRSVPENPKAIRGVYSPQQGSRPAQEQVGNLPFATEFFILGLEWTSSKMVWTINGVPYMEQVGGLPTEPLYLVLTTTIAPGYEPHGEARLEVDWVRCTAKRRG